MLSNHGQLGLYYNSESSVTAEDLFEELEPGEDSELSWVLLSPEQYLKDIDLKSYNKYRDEVFNLVEEDIKAKHLDPFFVPSAQIMPVVDGSHKIIFNVPILGYYNAKIRDLFNDKEWIIENIKKCLSGFIGEDYLLEDRFSVKLDSLYLEVTRPVWVDEDVKYVKGGEIYRTTLVEFPPSLVVTLSLTYINESELLEGGEKYEEAKERFGQDANI